MEILTLGNKIKNKRKELGLTLKELAGDRVTPAQLSYVETDKCKPSLDLLEYIAEKLGLEMDYLLESEKKQVSRFCDYNIKLAEIDIIKQNYKDAEDRLIQVLYASESYNIDLFYGLSEKYLGKVHKYRGEYDKANECYLNALQKFSKIDNHKEIIETYIELGSIAYNKKYYSSSLGYFKQAEKLVEKLSDVEMFLKTELHYYLMMTYSVLKNEELAVLYAEKLSKNIEFLSDKRSLGEILLKAGMAFEERNMYDKALELVEKALYIFNDLNHMEFIALAETNLGIIYSKNSMFEKSFDHLYRALEIKKSIKDSTVPLILLAIAQNHTMRKDYDRTFEVINEALSISINTNNREYEALSYYELFKTFNVKGEYIKAEESIRKFIDIFEALNSFDKLIECYTEIGEFYKKINREKEALNYVSKAVEIYKAINSTLSM